MSISYGEAISRLHQNVDQLNQLADSRSQKPYASVKLSEGVGRLAYEDVESTMYLPPFDNSAMDGYAVSSSEVAHASAEKPVRLQVLGSIAAGDPPPSYSLCGEEASTSLSCWRINTGAPFPRPTGTSTTESASRYDACARIEITRTVGGPSSEVEVTAPVSRLQHRRYAGEDFRPGIRILRKGARIEAGHIAALASNGCRRLKVKKEPRIAILTTGKELANPDEEADENDNGLREGQIFNSNGPYIRAALQSCGYGDARFVGSVGDDPQEYIEAIRQERGKADVLITTGGVSKGQHDYVHGRLQQTSQH